MRTAWADLNSSLMNLGATTLPLATAGVKGFDNLIKGVFDWSKEGPNKNIIDAANAVAAADKPHIPMGRDPRSPSTGPWAYFPPAEAPHSPSGPHGVVGPAGSDGMARAISAPPVTVTANVNATLAGKAEAIFSGATVELGGLGAAIDARIKSAVGSLAGSFQGGAGNSPSFHDSRMSPPTTDMGGIGHN